jgi:hypothetical protein
LRGAAANSPAPPFDFWSFCDSDVAAAILPDNFSSLRQITIPSGVVKGNKEIAT